jgi:hypothetical protein
MLGQINFLGDDFRLHSMKFIHEGIEFKAVNEKWDHHLIYIFSMVYYAIISSNIQIYETILFN